METEKRKSLQGSVLFTVVCVMALLIIFLTGTLALASASSNRAHKSYSSSQANYTARATIESFINAMKREPGIPAAIENITTDPIYASVVINDKTLGQIGCYKSGVWTPDVIEIAPVENNKPQYIYTAPKGDGNWKWVQVTTVKITAVCRVGKEEETVTAFVKKSPSGITKTEPGGIDGLQEAGGNAFPNGGYITGGLGVGIAKDNIGLYSTHNQTHIATKLSYINGSFVCGTGSFRIDVRKPVSDKMPFSQTIIMGNLWMRNSSFLYVDYDMKKGGYSQKDIPYLYIDQTLLHDSSLNLIQGGEDNKGSGPFNVFIGTFHQGLVDDQPVSFGNADLYLMDTYQPGEYYSARYCSRDYSTTELSSTEDKRDAADKAKDIDNITIGDNYLGSFNQGCYLYNWTSSFVQKTDDIQGISCGGNVFCNGNLHVSKFNINGDLRVMGDCTIEPGGLSVGGKIVVKGKLTVNDSSFSDWDKVYCDTVSSASGGETYEDDVLNDDYEEHIDEIQPGFIPIHNFAYENTPLPEDSYEFREAFQDSQDGWRWHLRYPGDDEHGSRITDKNDGWGDDGNNVDGKAFKDFAIYVVTNDDLSVDGQRWSYNAPYFLTSAYGEVLDNVVYEETSIYKANPEEPSELYFDDTGNAEKIDNEYSYYRVDSEGNILEEVSKDEATRTYYNKKGDPTPVSKDEAYGRKTLNKCHRYGEFGAAAYPMNMTREKILGYYNDAGEFVTDPNTKIVKNLLEMRKDLNFDEYGMLDPDVYLTEVPKEYCLNASDDTDTEVDKLPYAFNSDGSKNTTAPSVWEGDSIVRSCIIGNPTGSEFVIDNNNDNLKNLKKLKIKSNNTVWIVLRNVTFSGGRRQIECDTSKGAVKFLIDGKLISNEGLIINPAGTYDGCTVDASDSDWKIEFYGKESSEIILNNGGGSTLFGTFMCPNTTFTNYIAGAWGIYYKDGFGEIRNANFELDKMDHSPIIGSAMFDHVEQAQNNFGVLNSGSSGGGSKHETVETTFGTYDIDYFMGI